MNCKKFLYKIRLLYLLNIPLLLLILRLKLNIYLTETEEYYECDIPTYTELVLSERSNNEPFLTADNFYFNYTFDNVCEVPVFHKYKNAILSYNHLILTQYKILDSNPVFNSSIISILKEKPSIIC